MVWLEAEPRKLTVESNLERLFEGNDSTPSMIELQSRISKPDAWLGWRPPSIDSSVTSMLASCAEGTWLPQSRRWASAFQPSYQSSLRVARLAFFSSQQADSIGQWHWDVFGLPVSFCLFLADLCDADRFLPQNYGFLSIG